MAPRTPNPTWEGSILRTRASVCERKLRFASEAEARAAAERFALDLRPYRCDRCARFHLTGRTKGKFARATG